VPLVELLLCACIQAIIAVGCSLACLQVPLVKRDDKYFKLVTLGRQHSSVFHAVVQHTNQFMVVSLYSAGAAGEAGSQLRGEPSQPLVALRFC
jgi:hypothetical protein